MTELEKALAWMTEHGRGYKAAAKEFDVDAAEIKKLRRSRTKPKTKDDKEASARLRARVLAWCDEHGAGPVKAGREFGIPSNRVKYWLGVRSRDRRANEASPKVRDPTEQPGVDDLDGEDSTFVQYIEKMLRILEHALDDAPPRSKPSVVKQLIEVRRRLDVEREREKAETGAFSDVSDLLGKMLDVFEFAPQMVTRSQAKRLDRLGKLTMRLTAAESGDAEAVPVEAEAHVS